MRKARQNELGLRVKISCNHEYVRFHRKQWTLLLPHFGSSALHGIFLQEEHLQNSPILTIGMFSLFCFQSRDYIRWIVEWSMNGDELQTIWKEAIAVYSGICLEGLQKPIENLIRCSRCPGQDSN
jgi:hypothetical protein